MNRILVSFARGLAVLLVVSLTISMGVRASATSAVTAPPEKVIPFMRDKEVLKAKDALAKVGCRPLIVSMSPPIPTGESMGIGTDLTVAIGPYRFVRTDVGNPDGRLSVTRGGLEICLAEISILSGIRLVPGQNLMLLKFSSGSGSDWQIFQLGSLEPVQPCLSLGIISNKEAVEFERKLNSLASCR